MAACFAMRIQLSFRVYVKDHVLPESRCSLPSRAFLCLLVGCSDLLVPFVFENVVSLSDNRSAAPAENNGPVNRHVQNIFQWLVQPYADVLGSGDIHSSHVYVGVAVIDDRNCVFRRIHRSELRLALDQHGNRNLCLPENTDVFREVPNSSAGGKVVTQHMYRNRQSSRRTCLCVFEKLFKCLRIKHVYKIVG